MKILVLLFAGLFGSVATRGLDDLSARLGRVPGVIVKTYSWTDWPQAVEYARERKDLRIVMVGHSLGAGAAINAARALDADARPVEELVAIDGRQPWSWMWIEMDKLPNNVLLGIGYQRADNPTRGLLRKPPAGLSGGLTSVLNIRSRSRDHLGIASEPSVHRAIERDLWALLRASGDEQAGLSRRSLSRSR